MKPPIIFARCCKSVLGCQSCVDTWYRGDEGQQRTFPNCREARAYVDTCKINGLDDFLTGIAPLLEVDSINVEGEEDV
jgi:pectin methylesterase-like acyl-CoA thioesterase